MARRPSGPLGNSPRDLRDDFVGEPAEEIKAPAPMRWPPNPKKVTKNTFHAKVSGKNAQARADRAPFYRRGGMVHPRARGGDVKEEKPDTGMPMQGGADIGKEKPKYQFGGRVSQHTTRHVLHGDPLRSHTVTTRSTHRDRLAGEFKGGGRITTAQRKALPSSDFALPGKGTGAGGKGPGSYPIDTEARARNALARGAQHAGPAKLATIKAKVRAKYPGIKQT